MVIKMFTKLGRRMDAYRENFNKEIENIWKELKNTITELKSMLEELNGRLDGAEESISDLENRAVELTQTEQWKEKEF